MALFSKQDFSPPILSRKWIAIKFRPNMLIYSHENIITILESGLLFREDSIEVEQESPSREAAWRHAGGVAGGWLTIGERNSALIAMAACVMLAPPRNLNKLTLARVACVALIPVAVRATHRSRCRGSLRLLVAVMLDYLSLVRRATACCREYAALYSQLGSVSSTIESARAMLQQQQRALLLLMSRATSSLLGNVPWLRGDIAVECDTDNLMKLHHAFLVVQSMLLKYIALAHHIPSQAQKLYKNHNERIHWIHNALIDNLTREFRDNLESLERMYRLLKNYGTKDNALKKPGNAIKETWHCSEVHAGVSRTCLELKIALNRCNDLDVFLDSCAANQQDLDLDVLNKDIDDIIEDVTKSLKTVQCSQIRLMKLQNKSQEVCHVEEERIEEPIVKIEDKEREISDEVFYCVRTDDDDALPSVADVVTGPGKKEKETTRIVLDELRRKLVGREDLMRERERQALAKAMPHQTVPEFPRQIDMLQYVERKGFLSKVKVERRKAELKRTKCKKRKEVYRLKISRYTSECEIRDVYEANARLNVKSRLLTIDKDKGGFILHKWIKVIKDNSSVSELSGVESAASDNGNYKFNKQDLDITSSDSDFDIDNDQLLDDMRRYRAVRRKRFPAKRASIDTDEGMRPIEYRFGTGMAIASVLQINNVVANMAEEVFVGNGEVSDDSGNDDE